MRTKHNIYCEVFVVLLSFKEFAWLPRYYTETISFVTACSAARSEKYFIELEYPNVKNLFNQVQCTTLPNPTITSVRLGFCCLCNRLLKSGSNARL